MKVKKVKVKITNCSVPDFWYYPLVGQIIEVNKNNEYYFIMLKNRIYKIHKSDCEEIHDLNVVDLQKEIESIKEQIKKIVAHLKKYNEIKYEE